MVSTSGELSASAEVAGNYLRRTVSVIANAANPERLFKVILKRLVTLGQSTLSDSARVTKLTGIFESDQVFITA